MLKSIRPLALLMLILSSILFSPMFLQSASAQTTVTGPLVDNGDGSYTVPVSWTPGTGYEPGVVLVQPGRPPVVIGPKPNPSKHPHTHHCHQWKCLGWLLLLLLLLILLLWLFRE